MSQTNRIMIYDAIKGKCLRSYMVSNNVSEFLKETAVRSDRFYYKKMDGSIESIMPDKNKNAYHYYILDLGSNPHYYDVVFSEGYNYIFTRENEEIKVWYGKAGDQDYKRIADYADSMTSFFSFGSYLGYIKKPVKEDSSYRLDLYDINQNNLVYSIKLPDDVDSLSYIGTSSQNKHFYVGNDATLKYYMITVSNGNIKEIDISNIVDEIEEDGFHGYEQDTYIRGNQLRFLKHYEKEGTNDKLIEIVYDSEKDETTYRTVTEMKSEGADFQMTVNPQGSMAYCFTGDGTECLVDLDTGKRIDVRTKKRDDHIYIHEPYHIYWDSEFHRVAVYDGTDMLLVDTLEGNILYKEENDSIIKYAIHEDMLYCYENGSILRQIDYKKKRIQTVDLKAYVETDLYSSGDYNNDYSHVNNMESWYFDKDNIILLNILLNRSFEIDLNTLEVKSKLESVLSYNSHHKYWCLLGYDWTKYNYKSAKEEDGPVRCIGVFKRYSLQELIKQGKEITKGKEMDWRRKLRYGIE